MKLKPWHIGYIPTTIRLPKKITAEDIQMAELAYGLFYDSFKIKLYFTQALIAGAILNKYIHHVGVITPTRYGKSMGGFGNAVILANMLKEVSIVGWDKSTADIIMDKMKEMLPKADKSLLAGLVDTNGGKMDKLINQVSKTGLVWANGGSIKTYSAKDTYEDSRKKGTGFIGIGGDVIIVDESALVSDSSYSTIMRSFIEKEDTKIVEYSNPHQWGHFKKLMETDDPSVYRVWINKQTAIEEGRFNPEKIKQAETKMDARSIRIFYDCEFDLGNSDNTLFKKLPNVTQNINLNYDFVFAGLDCAYRGSDKTVLMIYGVIGDREYVIARHEFKPDEWKTDTYKLVAMSIVSMVNRYNALALGIDIGGVGALLFEAIRSEYPSFAVYDVNFGAKVTPERLEKDEPDSATVQALNKRAEMYIDLRDVSDNNNLFIADHIFTEDVEKQFVSTEFKINKGKYQLMPKEEIIKKVGHSPDELDAIVLAKHAQTLYNVNNTQSTVYII